MTAPQSNSQPIVMHYDFNPALVKFSGVGKNKKGGQIVYVKYGPDEQNLLLQTPAIDVPFGVSPYTDPKTGEVSYSLDISFRGADKDREIKDFQDRMTAFDNTLIQTGVDRSSDWFGKKMSKEFVGEVYRPLVKPAKDPSKYAPTMKVKIIMRDGTALGTVFDENRRKADMDYVIKGSRVRLILEVASVWFVSKSFGVTWRLSQCLVVSRPARLEGFAFNVPDAPVNFEDDDAPVDDEEAEPL